MGQAQSYENSPSASTSLPESDAADASSSPMGSLLAEAAAYGGGGDENESIEAKAEKALECPCIADLRSGPCGSQFSEAFLCFLKSTAEEKGSDCVNPFVALQNCIKANPDAFSKDVLEDEEKVEEGTEKKAEQAVHDNYRIIPPIWAKEPRSGKSKL
ncbi:PREDICTED: mitochondrial intermembrane space import and assembly protein 40 [Tarenaya hassleriana]|uniref:mitochondrial intermembrane space import and assembly protein 40 n=1 Tax=Tarenaya hassleriana TaxID=28532 RepID=UPI00053C1116|nr:PREDICTED: mitochondrial intermembrane space import and assembly protein 40 [Tarenaya hassleriana]